MSVRNKFDRTKWSVERERFRLTDPVPPPPHEPDLSLRPAISRIFQKMDNKAGSLILKISKRWSFLAGKNIASHSCPGRLDNNILYVYVDSSTWLVEIKRYHSAAVLSKIQNEFGRGTVKDVRYQVNPGECRIL